MLTEWAIIFLGTIAGCVYFSYSAGMKEGVVLATQLTLDRLRIEGLIHFDSDGNIKSGKLKRKKMIGDMIDEYDGK